MRTARAYTLIELLITVAILGIAGAMVIPAMTHAGALRIHAAVRTLVADLTFAQSDAMAFQSRRVVVFGRVAQFDQGAGTWAFANGNGYTLFAPPLGAGAVNETADMMFDPYNPNEAFTREFSDANYGGAVVSNAVFNGVNSLVFDELGGTAATLTSDEPGVGGGVDLVGPDVTFTVSVEAFTGRITVTKVMN